MRDVRGGYQPEVGGDRARPDPAEKPEAAGTPSVVRHRELAGEGWRQTAERLVEYLERRSTRWPG